MLFARWICRWRSALIPRPTLNSFAALIVACGLSLMVPLALPGQVAEIQPPVSQEYLSEPRVWKDNSSTFSVLARLRGFEDGKAVLERSDNGRIARVPFETFCREDLLFLLEIYQVQLEQGAVPSWPNPPTAIEAEMKTGGSAEPEPAPAIPDTTPSPETTQLPNPVELPELDPPPQLPEFGTTRPEMQETNRFLPERSVDRFDAPVAERPVPHQNGLAESPTQSAIIPQRREDAMSHEWETAEPGLSVDSSSLTSESSFPTSRVPAPDHSPFDMLAEERLAVENEAAAFETEDIVNSDPITEPLQFDVTPGEPELVMTDDSETAEEDPLQPAPSGGSFRPLEDRFQPTGDRFRPGGEAPGRKEMEEVSSSAVNDFPPDESGTATRESIAVAGTESMAVGGESTLNVNENLIVNRDSAEATLLTTRSASLSHDELQARLKPSVSLEWDNRYGLTSSLDPTVPMLRTCFQIRSDVARDIFRVTVTEFSGLKGDNGSEFIPERIPPGKSDVFRDWKGVVPHVVDDAAYVAEIHARFQPADPLPDFINPLTGQMTIDVANQYQEFTLPALEGALTEEALLAFKDLGIELRIRNPDARSVVIEFAGNHSLVGPVELIGDNQANVQAQRSSTSRSTWIQFNTLNVVGEDTHLRMRVVVDSRSISVPLQSERMLMPAVPN